MGSESAPLRNHCFVFVSFESVILGDDRRIVLGGERLACDQFGACGAAPRARGGLLLPLPLGEGWGEGLLLPLPLGEGWGEGLLTFRLTQTRQPAAPRRMVLVIRARHPSPRSPALNGRANISSPRGRGGGLLLPLPLGEGWGEGLCLSCFYALTRPSPRRACARHFLSHGERRQECGLVYASGAFVSRPCVRDSVLAPRARRCALGARLGSAYRITASICLRSSSEAPSMGTVSRRPSMMSSVVTWSASGLKLVRIRCRRIGLATSRMCWGVT